MGFGVTPQSSDTIPLGAGAVADGSGVLYVLKMANGASDAAGRIASLCYVRDATTVLNQASAAQTATGHTADLSVGAFSELLVGFNITAVSGTSPTIQFSLNTRGPDGVYYPIWTGSSYSTQPQSVTAPIGAGCANNQAFGSIVQLKWTIGGTTPSWTFGLWMIAK